jgi:iron(III) transport system permease protein
MQVGNKGFSLNRLGVTLTAGILLLPVLTVIYTLFLYDDGTISHLMDTRLNTYLINTVWLVLGVGSLTFMIGSSLAWATTHYCFPYKRPLEILLMLPLAMPAYVSTIAYMHLLTPVGNHPDIRSLGGAILILSFSLYPYVYMLARTAFASQSRYLWESAELLGLSKEQLFFKLALPIARPAIMVGVALALMETLADFGTLYLLGAESFTTGIYRAWFAFSDHIAAGKMAAMLLLFVILALALERLYRGQAQYNASELLCPAQEVICSRNSGIGLMLLCSIPTLLGFIIPAITLSSLAIEARTSWFDPAHFAALYNSLGLAIGAGIIILAASLWFAYAIRRTPPHWLHILLRVASSGYALPGFIIAVGIMIVFTELDHWLNQYIDVGLLFSGTVFVYLVRFLTIGFGAAETGLHRIRTSMDEAAHILGANQFSIIRDIHWPAMRKGLFTAGLIIMIDVIKELPASLLLRPFNFSTLSIRTFELASDEQQITASVPALWMIALAFVVTLLLHRYIK